MKNREQQKIKKKKMAGLSPNILIIMLNVNGLNTPLKRQKLVEWIKKHDTTMCCVWETLQI